MKYKIFVDGQEGTTGLMIHERLIARNAAKGDLEILMIDPEKRKDETERAVFLNEADFVFLCLPDNAAVEAVNLITNKTTRVIDASTAHRTDPGWAYGLPELSAGHRNAIKLSKRVSVPGCFASGFNVIIHPLVAEGLLPADHPVSCHSVTGYSGGGKKLIELYENENRDAALNSPCFYRLSLNHKHLPEMKVVSGLTHAPLFTPILSCYYKGMTVAVPFHLKQAGLNFSVETLREFYEKYYKKCFFIRTMPPIEKAGLYNGDYLPAENCNGTNRMEIFVSGNEDQAVVIARFDNLGKGSSGAAVQCMNIMLGSEEYLGLKIN